MIAVSIVFLVLILFIIFGLPIAVAIGLISLIGVIATGSSPTMIASRMYAGIDQFVLMAIPFFVFAGEVMRYSGITERIIRFVNLFVGRFRGGLAQANIYTSLIFAGITGSAISDVTALGAVYIPEMEKQGYTRKFSAMITAASSIVGPIIPPSIIIVLFGAVSGVSIGALFSAAIIPGVLFSIAMSLWVFLIRNKRQFPKVETKLSVKELAFTTKDTVLALLLPVIIVGGIAGGFFTPTEAAAVAVFYALFISLIIYRSISANQIVQALRETVRTSAMLFFIIGAAGILGWIASRANLPTKLVEMFLGISSNPYVTFVLIVLVLLFVGTWMEIGAACIILAPILVPMMQTMGIDPVHFGMVMIVTLNVGLITPPLGTVLFAAAHVGKVRLEQIIQEIWPLLVVDVIVIFLLVFIPELSLYLPRKLGFIE